MRGPPASTSRRTLLGADGAIEGPAPRPVSQDLGLELFRQRTLLQIMAARLREAAGLLDGAGTLDRARIRRAVDVHRRFLLEVHSPDAERLVASIPRGHAKDGGELVGVLADARQKAAEFEHNVDAFVEREGMDGTGEAYRISKLFQAEGERVEQLQVWEAEEFHPAVVARLPKSVQGRLLEEIRRFDAVRIGAEIALIAWASMLHPSAD